MKISDKLQLGFITAGNTIRITCTNTYVKPKNKTPKIKVNLFYTDGVKIENPEHMERSLRRARVSVVDYALTNRFDYFGTITFNSKGHDVSNPLACRDAILTAFNNYQKRNNCEFKYLLVAEYGEKTQRLHFHFLISGINKDELFINKNHKLDWSYTAERFGHTQITRIGKTTADHENVARYCSKYITKGNIRISNHRYFCSKSLKKPTISREYSPALTVLVSDWLEDNMQEPYAHNRMCKAYSIPKRIYKDLVEYIEKCKQKIAEKPWNFEEIDPCTFCPFDTWEQVTIC